MDVRTLEKEKEKEVSTEPVPYIGLPDIAGEFWNYEMKLCIFLFVSLLKKKCTHTYSLKKLCLETVYLLMFFYSCNRLFVYSSDDSSIYLIFPFFHFLLVSLEELLQRITQSLKSDPEVWDIYAGNEFRTLMK